MKSVAYKVGMDVRVKNFYQSLMLTWFFVGIGTVLFLLFYQLAHLMPGKSYFYYFIQNVGIFFMLTTFLMAYSGVYRVTTAPDGVEKLTKISIKETLKRSHYIFAISFVTVLLVVVIILIQVGISSLSLIPYAGAVIMALLTIPLFLVNIFCLLIAISIFALSPPLVAEAMSMKGIFFEMKISIRQRWINVLIFICISLAILLISLYLVHYLLKYVLGITMAVQWKLSSVYPTVIKGFSIKSFFTDMVYKVTPRYDLQSEFRRLGENAGIFINIVKYLVGISYVAVLSFIVSIPLTIYFNSSSVFLGRVRLDKEKE